MQDFFFPMTTFILWSATAEPGSRSLNGEGTAVSFFPKQFKIYDLHIHIYVRIYTYIYIYIYTHIHMYEVTIPYWVYMPWLY